MPKVLDPFDATKQFKSIMFFRADGTIWSPGSLIDEGRFTERQLRLFYETRRIGYVTEDEVKAMSEREAQDAQERDDQKLLAAGQSGNGTPAPVARPDPLLSTTDALSDADKQNHAQALVDAHSRGELVDRADAAGVEVKSSDTKATIATALVDAGVRAEPVAPAADPAPLDPPAGDPPVDQPADDTAQ